MSRNASISFDWADGLHVFRLGIGQLRELQEKVDAGPAFILGRLADGSWRVDDLIQTLRLGLIGGGMAPAEAVKLVRRYVEERPLLESIIPAQLVLSAVLTGSPDEELGKAKAAPETANSSQEENSGSPPSTEPVP